MFHWSIINIYFYTPTYCRLLTAMAKDTPASSVLPRWPQKIVLTKLTAKLMSWHIIWCEKSKMNGNELKDTNVTLINIAIVIDWLWLLTNAILTTGPASLDNSIISVLNPTGTNMRILCDVKHSVHRGRRELRALLPIIQSTQTCLCVWVYKHIVIMWSQLLPAGQSPVLAETPNTWFLYLLKNLTSKWMNFQVCKKTLTFIWLVCPR